MTERSEGVGGVDGTRTRGLRRDRPMPTTAHRSRPRKIEVGSSTSWPFKVDRGRVFGNGLQILASAGTFGPANVRKQPRTVGPVLSKIGFSRWLGSAKILVGGLSQFAALLTHMPFRDERHNLSYLGVLYNVRIVNHDVVWPGGHRPPKLGTFRRAQHCQRSESVQLTGRLRIRDHLPEAFQSICLVQ
jgi:hypothetical protein